MLSSISYLLAHDIRGTSYLLSRLLNFFAIIDSLIVEMILRALKRYCKTLNKEELTSLL